MTETSNVYANYLLDLGYFVKELALNAKERKRSATSNDELRFAEGRLWGLHEVVSLMQQQALSFGIPTNQIGLADIEPERDLI